MVIVWIVRIFAFEELFIVTDTVSVKITISIGCIERIEFVSSLEAVRHAVVIVIRIGIVPDTVFVVIRPLLWIVREGINIIRVTIVVCVCNFRYRRIIPCKYNISGWDIVG